MIYINYVNRKTCLTILMIISLYVVFVLLSGLYEGSYYYISYYMALLVGVFAIVIYACQFKKTIYSIEEKEGKLIFQCCLGRSIEVNTHDVTFKKSPWTWSHNLKWPLWRLFCERGHIRYAFTLEHNGQVYYIGNIQDRDIELQKMLASINIPVLDGCNSNGLRAN
ncbi:hypothetical protein K6U44_15285 [Vibrio parahaemolyticus]|uniref:hypothetical protein n=1 Tax=Vibrio parahaemolyticus TaxID=670 RepID=UPI001EEAEFBD|nr:hypothetical protein [Vibrio parahaemolyticus]MCG6461783.1 hypothetical protein [Vibrio parahaemolyticus]